MAEDFQGEVGQPMYCTVYGATGWADEPIATKELLRQQRLRWRRTIYMSMNRPVPDTREEGAFDRW